MRMHSHRTNSREKPLRPRAVQPQPRLGIFWVVSGRLLLESTPLSRAEPYSDFLTYPESHIDAWERLRAAKLVPADLEYEDMPRGRVVYDTKSERFYFYADACILTKRRLCDRLMARLRLPAEQTDLLGDAHYRCPGCARYARGRR